MTKFIIKRYLRPEMGYRGRKTAGIILSLMGVGFNLLLFVLKYTAGALSGSVAITADGFNNLADAGSCILALLGFKLGDMKPTHSYPFGYGRLEYLSGLLISAAILCIGIRMMISSVSKILYPQAVDGKPAVIVILLISISVKGYMYLYNMKIGKRIHSSGMRAAALDSLSDCVATLAILTAVTVEKLTGLNVDGYTGVLVAMCILYAGIISIKESLAPLLGRAIDETTLSRLEEIISGHDEIDCVHDIALHDYGPKHKLLTMTVAADDPSTAIALLRRDILDKLQMDAIIAPYDKENDTARYKHSACCQEYIQTKENQECEELEC